VEECRSVLAFAGLGNSRTFRHGRLENAPAVSHKGVLYRCLQRRSRCWRDSCVTWEIAGELCHAAGSRHFTQSRVLDCCPHGSLGDGQAG